MPSPRGQIRIRLEDEHVFDGYGDFVTQIPRVEKHIAKKIAEVFQKEILRGLRGSRSKLSPWRGNLEREISRLRPSLSGTGFVIDIRSNYASWHEEGTPHWTSPHKEIFSPLDEWAQDKIGGDIPRSLFVRPHPFIKPAIQPAAEQMRKVSSNELENELERILRA